MLIQSNDIVRKLTHKLQFLFGKLDIKYLKNYEHKVVQNKQNV
jgi:hypothetical protein